MGGNYSAVFLVVILTFGTWTLFAAKWTEWKDLTKCSAKPCGCNGETKDNCQHGKKVQIRMCIREEGEVATCGEKPINISDCKNEDVCPGWSDWSEWGDCNCVFKMKARLRFCNNPPPVHKDVLCMALNGNEDMKESETTECKCEGIPLTTKKTTTTTAKPAKLPWCCTMYDDNTGGGGGGGGGYYGYQMDYPSYQADFPAFDDPSRHERSVDYSYIAGVICNPCTSEYGYTGTTPRQGGGGGVLGGR